MKNPAILMLISIIFGTLVSTSSLASSEGWIGDFVPHYFSNLELHDQRVTREHVQSVADLLTKVRSLSESLPAGAMPAVNLFFDPFTDYVNPQVIHEVFDSAISELTIDIEFAIRSPEGEILRKSQVDSEPLVVHEIGHFLLDELLRERDKGYLTCYQLNHGPAVLGNQLNQLESEKYQITRSLVEAQFKGDTVEAKRLSAELDKVLVSMKDVQSRIRTLVAGHEKAMAKCEDDYVVLGPYHEYFADMIASLYYDDPATIGKTLDFGFQMGSAWAHMISFRDYSRPHDISAVENKPWRNLDPHGALSSAGSDLWMNAISHCQSRLGRSAAKTRIIDALVEAIRIEWNKQIAKKDGTADWMDAIPNGLNRDFEATAGELLAKACQ